jgi:hypothetical protein
VRPALARHLNDGALKTEDDPLDASPAANARASLAAIRNLEAAVTGDTTASKGS